jgi:hypothetical protein
LVALYGPIKRRARKFSPFGNAEASSIVESLTDFKRVSSSEEAALESAFFLPPTDQMVLPHPSTAFALGPLNLVLFAFGR